MDDRFADVLRGRSRGKSDARVARPKKTRLTKEGRMFLELKRMKPWSPCPSMDDLVGYEDGTLKREELASAMMATICQLRGSDASPVLAFQGPPGVGKSYVAACLARSFGMEAHVLKKTEIITSLVGEAEQRFARYLLARAADFRAKGIRQMVVIDEAEAIFAHRHEAQLFDMSPLIGVFNEFVNGARHSEIGASIVFILCMNRPDLIEEAVLSRALVMNFKLPDAGEIERLLIYHSVAKGVRVDADVNFSQLGLSLKALNASHRDVTKVVSLAEARAAMRELTRGGKFDLKQVSGSSLGRVMGRYRVTQADFLKAIDKMTMAAETGIKVNEQEMMFKTYV